MLVGYSAAAIFLVYFSRNQINPDAVAYAQVARHYAAGEFSLAVNSWWSPLYSWVLVPFVWAGADPVFAAKLLGVPIGAAMALGLARLVREVAGEGHDRIALAAGLVLALPMLPSPVSPDLAVSCLLVWYFVLAMRLLRGGSPRGAFLTGLLGGAAYLAKAYALPFVVVHLFLMAVLRWRLARRRGEGGGPWLKTLGAAYAGLFLVAAPWILTISLHDGCATISAPARYDRVLCPVSPTPEPDILPPFVLERPREGRLALWEDPTEYAGWPEAWSPWDSMEAARCQAATVGVNLQTVLKGLWSADALGLLLVGSCAVLWLAVRRRGAWADEPGTFVLWAWASVVIYCLGYTLLVVDVRFLWPVHVLLLAMVLAGLTLLRESPGRRAVRWIGEIAMVVLLASLAVSAVARVDEWRRPGGLGDEFNWNRDTARRLVGKGPVASNVAGRFMALYDSYWTGRVYVGASLSRTAEDVQRDLAPMGRTTVLVLDDRRLVEELAASPAFRASSASVSPTKEHTLWVFEFVPPTPIVP
jgi:hypothetical protein